uniref:Uncharacterized protein n=1 Tax=Magallana gigas TaxID=29159 RepID=A0A8W8MIF2_MAGGI
MIEERQNLKVQVTELTSQNQISTNDLFFVLEEEEDRKFLSRTGHELSRFLPTFQNLQMLKQLPDTDKDVLIKKWKDKINLFLSPEAISVGDALELQDGSRVTVRGTVKEEVEEQEKSFAGIITSIDFDSRLADVEVKGIEESVLIPPALLQELFPTSVFSTRIPLTGVKVGNKLVKIQRQTGSLGKTRQKREWWNPRLFEER